MLNKRLKLLREYIEKKELDCVIVTDENNVKYLSGFTGEGYLVVSPKRQILVTDFRYVEQAQLQSKNFDIYDCAKKNMKSVLSDYKRVGFENKTVSYEKFKMISSYAEVLIPTDTTITDLRAVKDEAEIELLKKAESIGDLAFEHILNYIKPNVSEREIALELEYFMRKNGAEAMSFNPIVAAGSHGSMPHAEPCERLIEKGDFVVMDFGCKYNGYCSDMTRTVCVGKADDKQRMVYDTVLKAQTQAIEMLCAGVVSSDIHNTAQKIIDNLYPGSFGHSLGHGVGLEIHERPVLSPKSDSVLAFGNVVTVEPGIYLPGNFGVRIEDVVVICDKNVQNITHSDKKLIEL